TVLPAVPIAISLINPTRNQLDSDKCVDLFLPARYPELVRDPSTILVAVTSQDMYIPSLGWRYAENMRSEGRFAVVSSARLHAFPLLEGLNPEWLNSRLQKLLNKNIAMLYFGLPMSSDYTSLVSGGVLSGGEIDQMTGNVIGAERHWDPFADSGGPAVTIYDVRGKPQMWNRGSMFRALPDTGAQVFSMSLTNGLMIDYKADFLFPNDPAMNFTRVYRNLDDRSRAFGIGGSHNFDMSLGGQMGVAVDLVTDDGTRIHFVHQTPVAGQRGDTYRPQPGTGGQYVEAVFSAFNWTVTTTDGWTYQFPYRPKALPQYVTVLTGFTNPTHQEYTMVRDDAGALLEIENPSGEWLKFENDSDHRIRKIKASTGRTMEYEYDANGGMIRATDSDGHTDSYTYDSKGEMLTASHGDGSPTLANEYFGDGEIKNQTLADGKSFQYSYFHDEQAMNEIQITDPNGLEIHVEHQGGYYREWLPVPPPH
ncbi:MAG TPA: DUF6531 domain-containing protein, partial [Candidatus Sulfotelmatobacter sp.]|nr:DUF6531 domain-containing protein [Candidatus Sulfotelmatobacter sp.]